MGGGGGRRDEEEPPVTSQSPPPATNANRQHARLDSSSLDRHRRHTQTHALSHDPKRINERGTRATAPTEGSRSLSLSPSSKRRAHAESRPSPTPLLDPGQVGSVSAGADARARPKEMSG